MYKEKYLKYRKKCLLLLGSSGLERQKQIRRKRREGIKSIHPQYLDKKGSSSTVLTSQHTDRDKFERPISKAELLRRRYRRDKSKDIRLLSQRTLRPNQFQERHDHLLSKLLDATKRQLSNKTTGYFNQIKDLDSMGSTSSSHVEEVVKDMPQDKLNILNISEAQRKKICESYIDQFIEKHSYNKDCFFDIENDSYMRESPSKIIAIGDIHGCYPVLVGCLKLANLIDDNLNWIGEDTYVVQTGDVTDSYRGGCETYNPEINNNHVILEELQILDLLYSLDTQAREKGGRVLSILGNHEFMNVMSYFNYVAPKDIKDWGGGNMRRFYFSPGGPISKILGNKSAAIIRIKDFIFCHGGLVPQVISDCKQKKFIHNSNDIFKFANLTARNFFTAEGEITQNSPQYESVFSQANGIIWNRTFGGVTKYVSNKPPKHTLDVLFQQLNIPMNGSMVIGHSIQDIVNPVLSNRVWRIDTGMSICFTTNKPYKNQISGPEKRTHLLQLLQINNNNNQTTYPLMAELDNNRKFIDITPFGSRFDYTDYEQMIHKYENLIHEDPDLA